MRLPQAAFAEGLAAMSLNPVRTGLSTLGVVMGIASVIATLALTDGLDQYVREQIAARTDVQAITVSSRTQDLRDGFPFPNRRYPVFNLRDAAELQKFLGRQGDVTMSVAGTAVVAMPSAPAHAVSVTATLANYLLIGMRDVLAGRYFTDGEVWHDAPVVVLSYRLAVELSPDGDADTMLGRMVRVGARSLRVIGVMPPYTGEIGYAVFLPLRGAAGALGHEGLTPEISVRAPSVEAVDTTKSSVIDWLATRYRDWDRQVIVATSLAQLEQVRATMSVLKLVLAAFAAIALVVGGIGIMNVLLASVAERTREIGVRKALGARRVDILGQFLAESVAIASVGSGVGTVTGFVGAFLVSALVRWQVPGAAMRAAVTAPTVLTAVISAALVGLASGLIPAMRAAGLSPIDAIRHD